MPRRSHPTCSRIPTLKMKEDGFSRMACAKSLYPLVVGLPSGVHSPPDDLPLPSNCPRRSDFGCYWARPEFRDVKASDFPNRVHSGARAVRYFTYGRMHEAGLYQTVEGIPLGVQLRFSVWLQTWMCANASACKGGKVSDAPARMHLQVGIDPWGGIDPWSSDVIWSPEGEAFDRWQRSRSKRCPKQGWRLCSSGRALSGTGRVSTTMCTWMTLDWRLCLANTSQRAGDVARCAASGNGYSECLGDAHRRCRRNIGQHCPCAWHFD